jgi:hypothetical protein
MAPTQAKRLALVAEDKLTEAVLKKCVAVYLPEFQIVFSEVKGGRGNVQKNLDAYSNLATSMPVLIGVDLDSDTCASSLVAAWLGNQALSARLLLRVAVREVESWVLGDRKQVAKLIGGQSDDITGQPDLLVDPKRYFLDRARTTAKPDLKRDLIPRNFNVYPRIGPAYNLRMCQFVREKWRPTVAASRSESLARAVKAISALAG